MSVPQSVTRRRPRPTMPQRSSRSLSDAFRPSGCQKLHTRIIPTVFRTVNESEAARVYAETVLREDKASFRKVEEGFGRPPKSSFLGRRPTQPRRRRRISSTTFFAGTRSWTSVSRSRSVTVPSLAVSPSIVMQKGVPISSWRR